MADGVKTTPLRKTLKVFALLCLMCSLFAAGATLEQQVGFMGEATLERSTTEVVVEKEVKEATAPPGPRPAEDKVEEEETEDFAPRPSPLPSWAIATPSPGGKLLKSFKVGRLTVTAEVVGEVKALKRGYQVDAKTNEAIVKKGDPLMMVAYKVANTSKKPVVLDRELVTIDAAYKSIKHWPWIGPMGGDYTLKLYKAKGYVFAPIAKDFNEDEQFLLAPGEAYTFADTYPLVKDAKLNYKLSYKPKRGKKVEVKEEVAHW